jgi:glycosyltransferase involved in cell wall biosynthesis
MRLANSIEELSEQTARAETLPKVAVLCPISGLGGAEISLLETVAHLRGVYEFHLMVPREGALKDKGELAGARVWILPWPEAIEGVGETAKRPSPVQILRFAAHVGFFIRKLAQLLDEIGPSVFVTNSVKSHVIGALTRKRKGVPLIWYMRDGLEERPLSGKVLGLLSRRCDLAVCVSRYVAEQVRNHVSGSMPAKIVPDIVDLGRFRPEASAPADLRRKPGEIWFGIVGAITPLKGHDIFLDAAEAVVRELPAARFVIAGNNPYVTEAGSEWERSLRRRVETSGLRERVRFVGFRNDMPNVMAQLDVLVQPNRGPEGLGRSVLEAMACGVPVIAVNKWGPAELIDDSRSGLLFAPLDREQLAAHMLTLGESASLRNIMGKMGHEWIHRNLVAKELARKFHDIVSSAIAAEAIGSAQREVLA